MEEHLLGQILLNFKLVTLDQLNRALEIQLSQNPPKMLGEILIEQRIVDEKSLRSILSIQRRTLDLSKTQTRVVDTALRQRLQGAGAAEILKVGRELGASDVYITSPARPMIRLHGNLIDLPLDPLSFEGCRRMLFDLLSREQVDEYYARKHVDFVLTLPEAGRFRANVFRHFRGIGGSFRVIADRVWPFEKLGLPPMVREFLDWSRGMILVTGPAGSGKSTTLATLVDLINRTRRHRIIMIEDQVEVAFRSDLSVISQRQVPGHSRDFSTALRAALREDPDVIVVGELCDPETVSTAIAAAETGHLIFGTLHTQNAQRTVLRLLDQFPAQKRAHIRTLLASVLRVVICQQLVPNLDGKGRSLAYEVMVVNSAISNLIREDRAWQIPMVMQTGRKLGMRPMDDILLEFVQKKKISLEEALLRATDRTKFLVPAASAR